MPLKIRSLNTLRMTNIKVIGLLLTLFCIGTNNAFAQSDAESREEIESINHTTEQLYQNEDVEALSALYAKDLTFFVEYKPAILSIERLKFFFKDWFKLGDIKTYTKRIYKVELYADYLLEIGDFNMAYSSRSIARGEYAGKYMVMWRRDKRGNLSIVSETFGAHKYIEPEDVPYAEVQMEESKIMAKHPVSRKVQTEVEKFDDVVLKAVAEGDGNARANGFTNNAILLAAFDSMHVGMETIRPKMLKTYTKDVSFIVKHNYYRIYDLGDYVFVNGHYKGGWGDSTNGGKFEGNIASLLKRMEDGKLLMYRQAGNRDSKLIVFKN